jgi:cob(I)alamin adenosyltransferase
MSIATKKGDFGATSLMFNRPVSKCDPHIEALGTIDELSAALGLARATALHQDVPRRLEIIQQDLITLMGELATLESDSARFGQGGFQRITPELTAGLDGWIKEIEAQFEQPHGWAHPGASLPAAMFDLARTICRRAERRACTLREAQQLANGEIIIYLNRLGDLLWLLARWTEKQETPSTAR